MARAAAIVLLLLLVGIVFWASSATYASALAIGGVSLVLCATTALLIDAHNLYADTNIAGGSLSGNTTW